MDLMLTVHPKE